MATNNQRIDIMDVSVEEFYSDFDAWLQRYSHMNLARWKLLQQTAISLLVAVLAIEAGADPTVSVAVIALINGLSFADIASIWGVSVELRGDGPTVQSEKKTAQNDEPETETERR